jgi:hypothetical protein
MKSFNFFDRPLREPGILRIGPVRSGGSAPTSPCQATIRIARFGTAAFSLAGKWAPALTWPVGVPIQIA